MIERLKDYKITRFTFLIFAIFQFCNFAIAQEKRNDIEIYRNSIRTFSFVIKNKDVSTDKIYFTVKKERVDSLDRLIYRRNLLAGGDAEQISASYTSPNTTVDVFVRRIDNWDLAPGIYQYDLISVDADDSNLVVPLYTGAFKIKENVLNAWDGTNLPDSGRTYFVLADGYNDYDFAVYDASEGRWLPISVDSVIALLNIEAVQVPDSFVTTSELGDTAQALRDNFQNLDLSPELVVTPAESKIVADVDSFNVRNHLIIGGGIVCEGSTGDIDGNDFIDILDFLLIDDYLSGVHNLTIGERLGADVNGNGVVDLEDQYIIGQLQFFSFNDPGYAGAKASAIQYVDSLRYRGVENDFDVGGSLTVNDYTFPSADGSGGQIQRTDGNGSLYWEDYSSGGSVGNADSLGGIPAAQYSTETDSLLKVAGGTYKLDYNGSVINGWLGGINDWFVNLAEGSSIMNIGKYSYNVKKFNSGVGIGAAPDYWNIDYVIPPFNLTASWLFPIEQRTDYYNDTLNTIANVANILNIDGTGTPMWLSGGVNITGNEIQMNIGDLPDSVGQTWASNYLAGSRVILSEANKTATPSRFSLPVKGYEFKFGSTPNYTYPYVYGFYSDLTTNSPNLENAYHFYGEGDYPSYFGGDILSDGYGYFADSIVVGSSTVKIYPDSITVGGNRLAKMSEVGGGDNLTTSDVNNLIDNYMVSNSITSEYTQTEVDDAVALANTALQESPTIILQGTVTGSGTDTIMTEVGDLTITESMVDFGTNENEVDGTDIPLIITNFNNNLSGTDATVQQAFETIDNLTIGTGTGDTTHYTLISKVIGLQDSLTALREYMNYVIELVSGCCDLSDNTPPSAPTDLVVTADNDTSKIRLTWTNPSATDLDSIRIYRAVIADTSAYTYLTRVAAGVTSYTDLSLPNSTAYWYKLKAVDDSSNVSGYSNRDSSTTIAAEGSAFIPDIIYADAPISADNRDSVSFTHWGSIQAGQMILLIVANESDVASNQWSSASDVSEAGWTFLGTNNANGQVDAYIAAFYKIASGSESGTFYVNHTTTQEACGWYLVLDSVDTSNPISLNTSSTFTETGALDTAITVTGGNTSFDYSLVFTMVARDGSDWNNTTPVWTNGAYYDDTYSRTNNGSAAGAILFIKDMWTADATGSCFWDHSATGTGDGAAGFQIGIKGDN